MLVLTCVVPQAQSPANMEPGSVDVAVQIQALGKPQSYGPFQFPPSQGSFLAILLLIGLPASDARPKGSSVLIPSLESEVTTSSRRHVNTQKSRVSHPTL